MSGLVPRDPAPDPMGGTRYTSAHPLAPVPLADPSANLLPADPHRPRAAVTVPPGCLAVKMANAQATSAGNSTPGQVMVLPHDEARTLTRAGLAREVLTA